MKLLFTLLTAFQLSAATINFTDLWGPATGVLDVEFGQTIMGLNFFWSDSGAPDILTVRINGADVPAAAGEFRWGASNGPLDSFRLSIIGDGVELQGGHIWHIVPRCIDCVSDVPEPDAGSLLIIGFMMGVFTWILTRKPNQ